MGDLEKWEGRYARDDAVAGEPNPFILAHLGRPQHGAAALDIAGGLGRHALALAGAGYRTMLLDISPIGLAKAAERARTAGSKLETVAADLSREPLPNGPFHRIVVSWFLLPEARWAEVADRLAPDGALLYVQPTTTNLERHPKPSRRFLFEPGAMVQAATEAGLEVLEAEEGWVDSGHHLARLSARR